MKLNKLAKGIIFGLSGIIASFQASADLKISESAEKEILAMQESEDVSAILAKYQALLTAPQIDSTDSFGLTLAYADYLKKNGEAEQAKALFDATLVALEESKGEASFEYTYASLRRLILKFDLGIKEYVQESNNLARDVRNYLADLENEEQMKNAVLLVKTMYSLARVTKDNVLRKIAEEMQEKAEKHLPPNDVAKVEADYYAGLIFFRARKANDSIEVLENLVARIDNNEAMSDFELRSRRALVSFYENRRKPELATPHVIAVAQMLANEGEFDGLVLRRIDPKYPIKAARAGDEGSAIIVFDIKEDGSLENLRIKSVDGNDDFGDSALAAVSAWRYAPKLVDGNTVAIKDKEVVLNFTLNRG